jgi:hypothetical protein
MTTQAFPQSAESKVTKPASKNLEVLMPYEEMGRCPIGGKILQRTDKRYSAEDDKEPKQDQQTLHTNLTPEILSRS